MIVDVYTADDLADGSEDEKKIERADRAAERKVGKRHKKRTAEAAAGKPRRGLARFATVAAHLCHPYRCQVVPLGGRPVGPCHFSGKMSHLCLYCPARASVEGKKCILFPFEKCSDEVVHGSEASCESAANCYTGSDNVLRKQGVKDVVKASNSAIVVECFVQSD